MRTFKTHPRARGEVGLGAPTLPSDAQRARETFSKRVFKSQLRDPLTSNRLAFLPRLRCGLFISSSAGGEEPAGGSEKCKTSAQRSVPDRLPSRWQALKEIHQRPRSDSIQPRQVSRQSIKNNMPPILSAMPKDQLPIESESLPSHNLYSCMNPPRHGTSTVQAQFGL